MLSIALNPGFVLLMAACIVLGAPGRYRAPVMIAAALGALALLLAPDFGRYAAFAQVGIAMVPLRVDALSYLFGLALIALTIVSAIAAGGRDKRYEDAALMLTTGAAVAALFAGDIVSFVAALELAGLGAAWLVFCAPGGGAAGVRQLIWLGLQGLLLLFGAAFQFSAGASSEFGPMSLAGVGGVLLFVGLAIQVGAPLAHVWIKDMASHANANSAPAAALAPALLGLYGLARAFAGAEELVALGLALAALGAMFSTAEDDVRRAAADVALMHLGLCLAALGLGAPLAVGAAAMHAFTMALALALFLLAAGALGAALGGHTLGDLRGRFGAAPVECVFLIAAAVAASGTPGFGPFVSLAALRDGASLTPVLELACAAAGPWTMLAIGVRPALALLAPRETAPPPPTIHDAFPPALAMGLAAFFTLALGLAPGWLTALAPPAPLVLDAYGGGRAFAQLALVGAASAAYAILSAVGLAGGQGRLRLLDVDALYRGPLALAAGWVGNALLQLYWGWRHRSARWLGGVLDRMDRLAQAADRPFAQTWDGPLLAGVLLLVVLAVLATIAVQP